MRQANAEHEAANSGEFARDSYMAYLLLSYIFNWCDSTGIILQMGVGMFRQRDPKSTFAPPFRSTLFLILSS
jgi:hypothetical protein